MPQDLRVYRAVDPHRVMEALGYAPTEKYANTLEYRLSDDRKLAITLAPRNATQGEEYMFQCWNGETFRQNKRGGAGAIDLVMTVTGKGFRDALWFLTENFFGGTPPMIPPPVLTRSVSSEGRTLPTKDPEGEDATRRYLCFTRGLPMRLVTSLMGEGIIYPNIYRYEVGQTRRSFTNAVFLMRDDETGAAVGAMIRGCYDGIKPRKSTLPLANGQESAFWVGEPLATAETIVLTESPLECLSYLVLHPKDVGLHCRTYGGNRWRYVKGIFPVLRGRKLICAFNNDGPGLEAAAEMRGLCEVADVPFDQITPRAKDWNEELRALTPLFQPDLPSF